MTDAHNDKPTAERTTQSNTLLESNRWPLRLALALIGFTFFVLVSLPEAQARSTHWYDNTLGKLEALVPLIPGIVILPALAVSVLRLSDASSSAKLTAWLFLIVCIIYDVWLCRELVQGALQAGFLSD